MAEHTGKIDDLMLLSAPHRGAVASSLANGVGLAQEFWEHCAAPAWVKTEEGRFLRFNRAYLEQFGAEAIAWLGRTDAEVRPAGLAKVATERDRAAIEGQRPVEAVESHRGPDGDMHHFVTVRFPIVAEDGRRYVGYIAFDISAQKAHTDELARLAVTDPLTGLYNRRGYMLLADHELRIARRRKTRCALLFIDVDGLKQANDAGGHAEGDLLLVETAILLRDVFRESDVIGRIGGDEFSVFAPDVGPDAGQLKTRLHAQLEHFPRITQQPRPLSLSIGVASVAPDERLQLERLVAAADRACYLDKRGKGRRSESPERIGDEAGSGDARHPPGGFGVSP